MSLEARSPRFATSCGDSAEYPGYALKQGDIVTTGTLTRAIPVVAGETWSTELSGVPLSPLKIAFS